MNNEPHDRRYVLQLEEVIRQMLTPLKGVPFNLVIEAMTGHRVLAYDAGLSSHRAVFDSLVTACRSAAHEINQKGIQSKRANEVGNRIEPFVKNALNSLPGVTAQTPKAASGRHKSSGYPDIEVKVGSLTSYVECKTYSIDNIATSQRSFYLSPSHDFKVTCDALHFIAAFEMHSSENTYKTTGFKLLAIEHLALDVKYEFNSDNLRLYSGQGGTRILHEERI